MTDIKVATGCWNDDETGALSTWFVKNGEQVTEGDLIGELMSDKVTFEVLAPASGPITLLVEAEQEVRIGETLARIGK